jgi:hypothetical protein
MYSFYLNKPTVIWRRDMGLTVWEAIGIAIGCYLGVLLVCFGVPELIKGYVGARADAEPSNRRYRVLSSTPHGPGVLMPVIVNVANTV